MKPSITTSVSALSAESECLQRAYGIYSEGCTVSRRRRACLDDSSVSAACWMSSEGEKLTPPTLERAALYLKSNRIRSPLARAFQFVVGDDRKVKAVVKPYDVATSGWVSM
jgi:hypothetical protein